MLRDIHSELYVRAAGPHEKAESEGHPRAPGKGLRPLHSLYGGHSKPQKNAQNAPAKGFALCTPFMGGCQARYLDTFTNTTLQLT